MGWDKQPKAKSQFCLGERPTLILRFDPRPGDSLGGIVAAEDFLRRCELLQQLSWERWEVRSTIWL